MNAFRLFVAFVTTIALPCTHGSLFNSLDDIERFLMADGEDNEIGSHDPALFFAEPPSPLFDAQESISSPSRATKHQDAAGPDLFPAPPTQRIISQAERVDLTHAEHVASALLTNEAIKALDWMQLGSRTTWIGVLKSEQQAAVLNYIKARIATQMPDALDRPELIDAVEPVQVRLDKLGIDVLMEHWQQVSRFWIKAKIEEHNRRWTELVSAQERFFTLGVMRFRLMPLNLDVILFRGHPARRWIVFGMPTAEFEESSVPHRVMVGGLIIPTALTPGVVLKFVTRRPLPNSERLFELHQHELAKASGAVSQSDMA